MVDVSNTTLHTERTGEGGGGGHPLCMDQPLGVTIISCSQLTSSCVIHIFSPGSSFDVLEADCKLILLETAKNYKWNACALLNTL